MQFIHRTVALVSNHGQAWLRWVPALFFAITIFMFSATPGDEIAKSFDSLSSTVQTVQAVSPADPREPVLSPNINWLKVGHGIGYFCLGFSVLYALNSCSRNTPFIALALCCFYSIMDEFHQTFTPGRSPSSRDILLDSLAALGGILILLGIMKWRSAK